MAMRKEAKDEAKKEEQEKKKENLMTEIWWWRWKDGKEETKEREG